MEKGQIKGCVGGRGSIEGEKYTFKRTKINTFQVHLYCRLSRCHKYTHVTPVTQVAVAISDYNWVGRGVLAPKTLCSVYKESQVPFIDTTLDKGYSCLLPWCLLGRQPMTYVPFVKVDIVFTTACSLFHWSTGWHKFPLMCPLMKSLLYKHQTPQDIHSSHPNTLAPQSPPPFPMHWLTESTEATEGQS